MLSVNPPPYAVYQPPNHYQPPTIISPQTKVLRLIMIMWINVVITKAPCDNLKLLHTQHPCYQYNCVHIFLLILSLISFLKCLIVKVSGTLSGEVTLSLSFSLLFPVRVNCKEKKLLLLKQILTFRSKAHSEGLYS